MRGPNAEPDCRPDHRPDDVKADQLAVARGRQRNVDGWQRPEKPGDSD